MSTELITARSGKNFYHMMEIWKWCEEHFGKTNCFYTWDGNFADHTDDWVAFTFWDEKLDTLVKLKFPDMMSREEFENRVWMY